MEILTTTFHPSLLTTTFHPSLQSHMTLHVINFPSLITTYYENLTSTHISRNHSSDSHHHITNPYTNSVHVEPARVVVLSDSDFRDCWPISHWFRHVWRFVTLLCDCFEFWTDFLENMKLAALWWSHGQQFHTARGSFALHQVLNLELHAATIYRWMLLACLASPLVGFIDWAILNLIRNSCLRIDFVVVLRFVYLVLHLIRHQYQTGLSAKPSSASKINNLTTDIPIWLKTKLSPGLWHGERV